MPKALSDEDYDAIIGSEDPFFLVLRGHQAVEELLNLAISESLADPHVLEVKKLGFALKVDIASALGVIGDRALLLALNRIRNRFAHNRDAKLTKRDADALRSASAPHVRYFVEKSLRVSDVNSVEALDYLRRVAAFFIADLELRITELRDQKAHVRIVLEIAEEAEARYRSSGAPEGGPVRERVKEALAKEKAERRARGDL